MRPKPPRNSMTSPRFLPFLVHRCSPCLFVPLLSAFLAAPFPTLLHGARFRSTTFNSFGSVPNLCPRRDSPFTSLMPHLVHPTCNGAGIP
ncbi:hypothetical protein BDQ94DRAFT_138140 [Aspergillus welwitschiae]|uniref:Uncharacterized protein n=1 Tax=Aspergillus welwitschiae TaxID=1341132 RepID=A0A3F3QCR5_9EURO|nr:hypothetical protein BDQ94DRAFT_138140 [Aspergillus welwitschiae]RDH36612.1 hypothetical protein BDQ94DRAFT_138140 [Aspergillus welwitschiae]